MDNHFEHNDFDSFNEHQVRQSVQRFEEMLDRNEHYFFDLATIDDIYYYYIRENLPEKAISLIDFALDMHPNNDELHFKRSSALMDLGKYEDASLSIDRAISLNPYQQDYNFLRAEIMNQAGNYVGAIQELENIAGISDDPAEVFFQMGNLSMLSGELDDAEGYFRKALEVDPLFEDCIFELAYCLEGQEKIAEGIRLYEKYLDEQPFTHLVWYNLGILYSRIGLFEKAIDAYDFAIAIDETFASAYYSKGYALMELEKYDEALKALLEVAIQEKPDTGVLFNIAECYEELENLPMARRYYQRCTEAAPQYPEAWVRLGNLMEAMEKYLEAIHYYKKALALNSNHFRVWAHVARAEFRLGNTVGAYESLEHSLSLNPHAVDVWAEWGELLFRDGNPEGAITFVQEAIKANPNRPELYYQCAAYSFKNHMLSRGMNLLENALLLDFDLHYILFDIFADLKEVPVIQDLIEQYRK